MLDYAQHDSKTHKPSNLKLSDSQLPHMDFSNILLSVGAVIGILLAVIVLGYVVVISTFYRKVTQGKALVRTGFGETKVTL